MRVKYVRKKECKTSRLNSAKRLGLLKSQGHLAESVVREVVLNSGISTLTLGRLQNEGAHILAVVAESRVVCLTVSRVCPAHPSPQGQ